MEGGFLEGSHFVFGEKRETVLRSRAGGVFLAEHVFCLLRQWKVLGSGPERLRGWVEGDRSGDRDKAQGEESHLTCSLKPEWGINKIPGSCGRPEVVYRSEALLASEWFPLYLLLSHCLPSLTPNSAFIKSRWGSQAPPYTEKSQNHCCTGQKAKVHEMTLKVREAISMAPRRIEAQVNKYLSCF